MLVNFFKYFTVENLRFDPAVLISAFLPSLPLPSFSFSRVLSRSKTATKAWPPHGVGANLVCSLFSFYCLSEREVIAITADRIVFSFWLAIALTSTRRFPENFLRIPCDLEAVQSKKAFLRKGSKFLLPR